MALFQHLKTECLNTKFRLSTPLCEKKKRESSLLTDSISDCESVPQSCLQNSAESAELSVLTLVIKTNNIFHYEAVVEWWDIIDCKLLKYALYFYFSAMSRVT